MYALRKGDTKGVNVLKVTEASRDETNNALEAAGLLRSKDEKMATLRADSDSSLC